MRKLWHSVAKRLTRLRRFPSLSRYSGATFLLDPRNWIDNRLAAGAPYEAAQLSRAGHLVREQRLNTLIDVGANIGVYTVLIGSMPPIKQVLSFEPVRRNFNQLLGNVFANQLDSKVEAFRVALGSREGQSIVHIDPQSTGVSRLGFDNCARSRSVFTHREDVQLARFDDLAKLRDKRILLKIDVEGYAWEALLGMPHLFRDNFVCLQIEIDAVERSAITELLTLYGMTPDAVIGDDCYFIPAPHQPQLDSAAHGYAHAARPS